MRKRKASEARTRSSSRARALASSLGHTQLIPKSDTLNARHYKLQFANELIKLLNFHNVFITLVGIHLISRYHPPTRPPRHSSDFPIPN